LKWLQDQSQINVDNLNKVTRATSRHFRGGGGITEYLKKKINELETNSTKMNMTDLYRGINQFKKGCQLTNNFETDEKCDLLANSPQYFEQVKNSVIELTRD
jgi:hypothetical protein